MDKHLTFAAGIILGAAATILFYRRHNTVTTTTNNTTSRIALRFQQKGPSSAEVWAKLRSLANQSGIINLGQGFPDFLPIPDAVVAAKTALDQDHLNQYAAMGGSIRLKQALSKYYGKSPPRQPRNGNLNSSTPFNPTTEITVTTSGTEAVFCTFQALINPGDKVVVFEPSFPWYTPAIKLAGGIPICIELQSPNFSIMETNTLSKLRSIFQDLNPPKAIVINSPHNPTGHVLTSQELDEIEQLCVQYNCLIVSDEVYERCIFENHSLESPRQRPTLTNQTITIGSSSKLLSMTGWRVGWVIGPEDLIKGIRASSGYTTFCAPTPLQDACASILESSMQAQDLTFGGVSELFSRNFNTLKTALELIGLKVCSAEGGYFLTCDVSSTGLNDMEFVEHLVQCCKISALPMSLFYQNPTVPRKLVRFAICKKEETILKTVEALKLYPLK